MLFRIAQNVTKYLGYFCIKVCHQSGHTAWENEKKDGMQMQKETKKKKNVLRYK